MSTSIVDAGKPGEPSSAKGADSNVSSPQPTGGGGLPLPNVSVWAKWVLGSVFWFAVPLCKRVLSTEEVVEEKVEAAAEMADKAAEVVKKVAVDVATDLPEGGGLRKVVLEVEEVADMVIVYAREVEDFIHKVDEIKEEVEEAIEPLIKEAEAIEQGGEQKKNTCGGRKKI